VSKYSIYFFLKKCFDIKNLLFLSYQKTIRFYMIMKTPMMHDNELAIMEDDVLVALDGGPDDEDDNSDDLFEDEENFDLDEFDSLDEFDDFDDEDDF